jgi:hypothetical protein
MASPRTFGSADVGGFAGINEMGYPDEIAESMNLHVWSSRRTPMTAPLAPLPVLHRAVGLVADAVEVAEVLNCFDGESCEQPWPDAAPAPAVQRGPHLSMRVTQKCPFDRALAGLIIRFCAATSERSRRG